MVFLDLDLVLNGYCDWFWILGRPFLIISLTIQTYSVIKRKKREDLPNLLAAVITPDHVDLRKKNAPTLEDGAGLLIVFKVLRFAVLSIPFVIQVYIEEIFMNSTETKNRAISKYWKNEIQAEVDNCGSPGARQRLLKFVNFGLVFGRSFFLKNRGKIARNHEPG